MAYPARVQVIKDDSIGLSKTITTVADSIALGAWVGALAPNANDILEIRVTSATAQPADKDRPDGVQSPSVRAIIAMG